MTARVIRDLLANYTSRGSTVFVTSHVLEIVEKICSHVGVIANGELILQSSIDEMGPERTLEQIFLELVGTTEEEPMNLSWLESEREPQPKTDTPNSEPADSTGAQQAAATETSAAETSATETSAAERSSTELES